MEDWAKDLSDNLEILGKARHPAEGWDTAPYAKWQKKVIVDENKQIVDSLMVRLNSTYEEMFLKTAGLAREDYEGQPDSAVWGQEIALAYAKADQRAYDRTADFSIEPDRDDPEALFVVKWRTDVEGSTYIMGVAIPITIVLGTAARYMGSNLLVKANDARRKNPRADSPATSGEGGQTRRLAAAGGR